MSSIASSPALFPSSRIAVSLLFLVNGFTVGSWAPMIPEFKARLGLSEATLGLMILAFGVGSLVAMPLVGMVIARAGSRVIVRLMALALSVALFMLLHLPGVWFAAMMMFVTGGLVGGMDVAMNANAVSVERDMRRAIMSSCHGFWSLGGFLGAGLGGLVIGRFGGEAHVLMVTALSVGLVAAAWMITFDDSAAHVEGEGKPKAALPRELLPWLIGAMALACMIPEGAVLDWGALYLRQELGADIALSGFGFAAFSATMAVMRFAGDGVRNRFGAVRTLRVSCLFAGAGLAIAALAPNAPLAIAGFAIAGLGVANLVPIMFSAAGNLPGHAPGVAISVATFMGYSGILFAPSLIGFIAEHTGFAPIFFTLALIFVAVFAGAGLGRHADGVKG
ncbi:MAG: MFS transporter [Rhizobiaceae bacterium]|jgi:MFS family permease|nr:MFS transporter [Rhizobiaceae bacterium]